MNLFNRKVKQIGYEIKKSFEPIKDPQQVIAEIHESFDTASGKLLTEAKKILGGNYDIEKGERLKKIGFTSAKKAVEASEIIQKKQVNKELATRIEYYQTFYPCNKFITEDKVKEICQKYGLVCGRTEYYISDVPEKNLAEIEAFKLREEEMNKIVYGWHTQEAHGYWLPSNKGDKNARYGHPVFNRNYYSFISKEESKTHHFEKSAEFMICASVKDFDTKNLRIEEGYKLELNLPDPIVLQPVSGGYLIVSKWGLEASDEMVVNEINN